MVTRAAGMMVLIAICAAYLVLLSAVVGDAITAAVAATVIGF